MSLVCSKLYPRRIDIPKYLHPHMDIREAVRLSQNLLRSIFYFKIYVSTGSGLKGLSTIRMSCLLVFE